MSGRVPGSGARGAAGAAGAWRVSAEDCAALLRKYRVLAGWRRAKDRSHGVGAASAEPASAADPGADGGGAAAAVAEPRAMRVLAEEFPGALRELDLLGLPEIERRIALLARASERRAAEGADSDPDLDEPWIIWIVAYHALMREALAAKRAAGRRSRPDSRAGPKEADPSIDIFSLASSVAAADFTRNVANPPDGRLSVAVLRALASQFEIPVPAIAATLFPPRR